MKTSDVKAILGITSNTHDTTIQALLPLVVDAVESETLLTFEVVSNEKVVPEGLKIVVAYDISQRIGELRGIQALRLGDYSVTYDEQPSDTRKRIVESFKRSIVW